MFGSPLDSKPHEGWGVCCRAPCCSPGESGGAGTWPSPQHRPPLGARGRPRCGQGPGVLCPHSFWLSDRLLFSRWWGTRLLKGQLMMPGENYAFCLISITLMVTHFVCHILGHLPDDRLTMSPIGPSLSAQIPLEGGRGFQHGSCWLAGACPPRRSARLCLNSCRAPKSQRPPLPTRSALAGSPGQGHQSLPRLREKVTAGVPQGGHGDRSDELGGSS